MIYIVFIVHLLLFLLKEKKALKIQTSVVIFDLEISVQKVTKCLVVIRRGLKLATCMTIILIKLFSMSQNKNLLILLKLMEKKFKIILNLEQKILFKNSY